MLIAECHRFERQDRFARLVHRLDRFLETLRGGGCAEVTIGIDNYPYASGNRGPTDAGDKGARVSPFGANADAPGLASYTSIADIDIVIARGEIHTGINAQGDVAFAGCVF